MAMNGATLKALAQTTIYNKLQTVFTPLLPPGSTPPTQLWQNIADAVSDSMVDIITHITTQGVINTALTAPTVAVTSVSGVLTGVGVSGPGVGAVSNPAAIGTIS